VVEVLDIAAVLPRIRFECQETLRRNWREGARRSDGVRFAYTRPSPSHYPFQWYWDSCFSVMVWRRFDPTRARLESHRKVRNLDDRARRSGQSDYQLSPAAYTVSWHS